MAWAANLDSHMADSEQNVSPKPRLPWQFHPALTEERLRICGRLLANARRDAVALAKYEMGDDSWSVGCRAYAFGKQRLKRAATSRVHEWLSVMDDSHHFVFLIEKVPVRFLSRICRRTDCPDASAPGSGSAATRSGFGDR